uniref:Origin recognition complex subunit 5 C-terminal domain-containing protein n=1 Tax=Caenorhabditis japonica TaxID=281687 RepID=A0A8R1DTX2_CAEJA
MDEDMEIKRLKSLLFNPSRVISHVHVFGEDGSGRSEIVRQILSNAEDEDWVCAFGDFLYADGSLRLLLESLATDLGFKTKGDRAEDFICNVYEEVKWPDEKNKNLIIFLDNAQAIVNYPPAPLQCFLDSHKAIDVLKVRFVTSAPSSLNQYHIHLSHLPVIEFHVLTPSVETIKRLISRTNSSISPQFLHIAVNVLMMFCNSPNTLLAIITDAWNNYVEKSNKEKFDPSLAKECLNRASGNKLGNDVKVQKSNEMEHSFESMPLAMRYLLIAAYCASNNPSQTDGRYFAKNHGRDKRSERKELRAEENRQMKEFAPKAAELQRIVCIYKTLLMLNECSASGFDVKNVIASLDAMGLVSVTNRSNLDIPKIKCLISLESALKIAGSLKLELRNYLEFAN